MSTTPDPATPLPCPLCGNADVYVAPDEFGSGGQWVPPVHVGCKPCGLDLVDLVTDTREGAIKAWNRRSALSGNTPVSASAGRDPLGAPDVSTAPGGLQNKTPDSEG